jgi:hypothetical protein
MERERAIKLIGWICEQANLPEPIFPPHSKFREYGSISESGTGSCDIVSISPKSQKLLDDMKEIIDPEAFKRLEETIIDFENPPETMPSAGSKVFLTQMQIAWLIYFSEDLKKLIKSEVDPELIELIKRFFENPSKSTPGQVFDKYHLELEKGKASLNALLEKKGTPTTSRNVTKDLEIVIESGYLKGQEVKRAKEYACVFFEKAEKLKRQKSDN